MECSVERSRGVRSAAANTFSKPYPGRATLPMIYATLVTSMVAGRLVWGAVRFVLAGLSGSESFLISAPDYSQQEITWIAQAERVRCVDDILRRRTTLSLTGRESPALRDEIADLLPEPRQVESEPQAVVGIV